MGSKFDLEQLFKRCDKRGTGYIDKAEFRDLCRDLDIDVGDADILFYDLDHDGDGRISFDDFAFGFRDSLTPGARRGSLQIGVALSRQKSAVGAMGASREDLTTIEELGAHDMIEKQREMERKHSEAKAAWRHFADNLGQEDVNKFLGVR